ncbi:MAG: hypothetical protein QW292_11470 [Candidatus Parvarchaeota archaeon]
MNEGPERQLGEWKRHLFRMHSSFCISLPVSWVRGVQAENRSIILKLLADGSLKIQVGER